MADVENALEEMLFSGGSLNLKLLGAEQAEMSERVIHTSDGGSRGEGEE